MRPAAGPLPDIPDSFRPLSLAGGIRSAMQRAPDKIALRDRFATRTYAQLVERIDRVSHATLGDLGLGPGDHCAILSLNRIEYVELVAGLSQVGVAAATVNPRLSDAEITAICDDAGARVLFVDPDNAERARACRFASVERIVVLGEAFEAWLAAAHPGHTLPSVPEWLPFTIPYTSGTTGRPKGVLVSSRSRVLTLFGMGVEYACYAPEDRFLALAPMCHGAGMVFPLASVFFGGYAQLMDAFEPEAVLKTLNSEHISGVFMVPTHFHALFGLEPGTLAAHREHALRTIISNAAPLPQATKERIVEYFGAGLLHETYGSTEGGIVTNLRPPDQLRKQQCVGLPFPATELSVRDPRGGECATGEVGELFSRSPYLFNGYWQRPEETAEALHDGWCTVGDLARRDEEGYLYIVDRKKDMIITGGFNVYPREIEETLVRHPDILEAAVIGVPDERWGERLKAYVVTASGRSPGVEEMLEFCADTLARFKIPREFERLDALPRNASGKILKTELRTRAG
ncbi:MAG: AMP-binding protein [Xanthomonadales bacterium]|nr:AMP-binding protein [Xanthomonadales bacterium]